MQNVRSFLRQTFLDVSKIKNNGTTVRNFFKPKQKEAFFDVEGVVTKDTLLFRYEDVKRVRMKCMVGVAMFPQWAYLGYCAYNLKSQVRPYEENVENNMKISFLLNNVVEASTGVGFAFFLFGTGMSSYWMMRTMNTVRKLVLRKGGKYVAIQTYGFLGLNQNFVNIPVVHCSGYQPKFYGKYKFLLKVKNQSFKYSLNLEEGVFANKPLFDRTLGISRTF